MNRKSPQGGLLSHGRELNPQPITYEAIALPIELPWRSARFSAGGRDYTRPGGVREGGGFIPEQEDLNDHKRHKKHRRVSFRSLFSSDLFVIFVPFVVNGHPLFVLIVSCRGYPL